MGMAVEEQHVQQTELEAESGVALTDPYLWATGFILPLVIAILGYLQVRKRRNTKE